MNYSIILSFVALQKRETKMSSKHANIRKVLPALFVVLTAASASAASASKVTWAWNCESTDYITSGNTGNLTCSNLTSKAKASDMATTIDVESGHLKLTPATADQGGHFATVTLPADITARPSAQYDSWTFSFDYAPSKGKNNEDKTNYGLSVHDKAGNALVWFYGYQKSSFTIYKGSDDSSPLGTIDLSDITQYDYSEGATNWFRVVISASRSAGVTLALTNLASGAGIALSSNVISGQFAVPQSVLVRTASYAATPRMQWALLDEFSFIGATIYKKRYTKSLDVDFEEGTDQSILTNGFVTSAILGTTAAVNDSVNWDAVTGDVAPKTGEKFVQISSTQSSTQGLLVTMPAEVTLADEYVLEFDALAMEGYDVQNTNGVAIVGKRGSLATLRVAYNRDLKQRESALFKGDSEADMLATDMPCTSYRHDGIDDTPPAANECIWYHFIVRGDVKDGVRLSMYNLATGATVVESVSLGAYDTVEKIALRASIHSSRKIYAAIDNVVAHTYRKMGLVIRIL